MLINFNVRNFLSLKENTELSLEAGERLRKFNDTNTIKIGKLRLLKNIIIFGPNGSGKSNLIMALGQMRRIVLNNTKSINSRLILFPFFFDNHNNNSTSYNIEFIANSIRYEFEFTYDQSQFLSEKLMYQNSDGKKEIYYYRNKSEFEVTPTKYYELASMVRKNSLFLFALQDLNDSHAINVMEWFNNYLILENNTSIEDMIDILKNKEIKKAFLKLLLLADFNIKDIEFSKKEVAIEDPQNSQGTNFDSSDETKSNFRVVTTINTIYHQYDFNKNDLKEVKIPLSFESSGTRKFIEIILSILHSNNKGKVLIFDEFDDSFHLKVSQALIKLFNSEFNNNQFILTSHELQHLDCDLRKDQLYLVEKDFNGESQLYSLFDFNKLSTSGSSIYENKNSRHDISFTKRYLEGQFGSLPNIDFDNLFYELSNVMGSNGENE